MRSVEECLLVIGVLEAALESCPTLDEQFKEIKKMYFKNVLTNHPDKGGDANVFREVQESFELIREIYDSKRIDSFVSSDKKKKFATKDFSDFEMPSYEFYQRYFIY
jgi:DnaJ-class molecular chaperone